MQLTRRRTGATTPAGAGAGGPTGRARPRLGQAGYSLIEILVATGLAAVALTAFTAFNRFQLFALRSQAAQVNVQTNARSVVDLVAREIRRAGMNPTCAAGLQAITAAKSTEVQINSDLDGSGAIDGTNEDILYRIDISSKKVERVTGDGAETLLFGYDMTGSSIQYFDADGTQLVPASSGLTAAQRSSVRRIRIELGIASSDADPLSSATLSAQVSTDVDLRNRFFLNATVCTS